MKLVILIFIITSSTVLQAMDPIAMQNLEKNFLGAREACKVSLQISEEELSKAETLDTPNTKREKCIWGCLLEKLHIIEGGKFSQKQALKVVEYWFEDDPVTFYVTKFLIKRCTQSVEAAMTEDSCDVAGEVIACINRESLHYQIPNINDINR